jgi:hypothetical protein
MRSLESNPRTGGGIAKERITRRSFQNQSSLTLGWTITPITGDQMAAIGNQIDAAFVFARSESVNVCDPEKTQTMKKPMTRSRAAKKKALAITCAKPNKRSALSTRTKPPTPFDRCTCARAAAQTY